MIGLGTILNVGGIVLGGLMGLLFGRLLTERFQTMLVRAIAVCVMVIGVEGAVEKMLSVSGGGTLMLILSMVLGGLIGELLDIDRRVVRFGEWLKRKTGSARDAGFVEGFVTASLTVSIGAMAVVGAINDAIFGDYSVLTAKAILDFLFVLVMTASMGKGCIFSAIPVALLQGLVTALARLIRPLLTDAALANLGLVGSVLIFCVGLNSIRKDTVKVANLLPAIVIAAAFAFLPL